MVGQDLEPNGAVQTVDAPHQRDHKPLDVGPIADVGPMADVGRMASLSSAFGLGGRVAIHR
jgi:hypothetical protein